MRASVVVAHKLSCFSAYGVFPDQGSDWWIALQGGFLTAGPSGKPLRLIFFSNNFLIELPEPFIFSGCLFGMCGGARQQSSKTLCDKWGFCAHLNNIPGILQGLKFKFGPLSKQFGEVLLHPYRCCSVTRLCLTLCDPTDYSIPGFPALHYLPEFAQAPVH